MGPKQSVIFRTHRSSNQWFILLCRPVPMFLQPSAPLRPIFRVESASWVQRAELQQYLPSLLPF